MTVKEHLRDMHENSANLHLRMGKAHREIANHFAKSEMAEGSKDLADCHSDLCAAHADAAEMHVECCKSIDAMGKAATDEISRGGSAEIPVGDFDAAWLRTTAKKHEVAASQSRAKGDKIGDTIHSALAAEHQRLAALVEVVVPAGALDSAIAWSGKAAGMGDAIPNDGISAILGPAPVFAVPRTGQRELGKTAVAEGLEHIIGEVEA